MMSVGSDFSYDTRSYSQQYGDNGRIGDGIGNANHIINSNNNNNSLYVQTVESSTRRLVAPELLLRLYSDDGRSIDAVDTIILLETCGVYLLNDSTLLTVRYDDANLRSSRTGTVITTGIVCICGLYDQHRDAFLGLTVDGSIVFFTKNNLQPQRVDRKPRSVPFINKIICSLSDFGGYTNISSNASMIFNMVANESLRLLMLTSDDTVYLLTVDYLQLNTHTATGDFLVGGVTFPLPATYQIIIRSHSMGSNRLDPPRDYVSSCAFWTDDPDNTRGNLVCIGNGSWIDVMPIHLTGDDKVWELSFDKIALIRINTDHSCWISAISDSLDGKLFAVGDTLGYLSFWIIAPQAHNNSDFTTDSTKGNGGTKHPLLSEMVYQSTASVTHCPVLAESPLHMLFKTDQSINQDSLSITAIALNDSKTVWVGDKTGKILLLYVDVFGQRVEKLRNIGINALGSPKDIRWDMSTTRGSTGVNNGRLRVLFDGEVAYECILDDSISTLMNVWPEPGFAPSHRSQVEVSTVIDTLDLLVVAGCDIGAFVWDLQSCKLVCTIPTSDRFFTSLASSVYVDATNCVKIVSGHECGRTHEFSFCIPSTFRKKEAFDRSSIDLSMSRITSIDIFDVVDTEPDLLNIHSINQLSSSSTAPSRYSKQGDGVFKSSLVTSTEYCPMAVSDIFISSNAKYFLFCYSRVCIIVHCCNDNKATAQLQFNTPLHHISLVTSMDDVGMACTESLNVSIQGAAQVKIFDAILGQFLTEIELPLIAGGPVVCSALWESPVHDVGNRGNSESLYSIKGLYATHGAGVFAFGDNIPCTELIAKQMQGNSSEQASVRLDDLLQGLELYGQNQSPLATAWTLRKLLLLRMDMETHIQLRKIYEYTVSNSKVRIIYSKALQTSNRDKMHRVIVILSDGTVIVLVL